MAYDIPIGNSMGGGDFSNLLAQMMSGDNALEMQRLKYSQDLDMLKRQQAYAQAQKMNVATPNTQEAANRERRSAQSRANFDWGMSSANPMNDTVTVGSNLPGVGGPESTRKVWRNQTISGLPNSLGASEYSGYKTSMDNALTGAMGQMNSAAAGAGAQMYGADRSLDINKANDFASMYNSDNSKQAALYNYLASMKAPNYGGSYGRY
jgi:hypothetical protein